MTVSTPIISEEQLIQQAIRKDAKAFRELMSRYVKLVYSFVYRMVQQPELAEDMTQEIFVKVYQNLDKFQPEKPFKPWLLRIASNHTVSHLRKKANVALSLDALQEEQPGREWGGVTDSDAMPERLLEGEERARTVQEALNSLAPNYRQALLLRFQADLSYEEISTRMQVPVNTIRTWLKRGKARLQASLILQEDV